MNHQIKKAHQAGRKTSTIVPNKTNRILNEIAEELIEQSATILEANTQDLISIPSTDPIHQTLHLNPTQLAQQSTLITTIASQPQPHGRILESKKHLDTTTTKHTVPYGTIAILIDSTPLHIIDSFALTFKSGNALIIQSTQAAHNTNTAIITLIQTILEENKLDPHIITLLPPDQQTTQNILQSDQHIDLIIPRLKTPIPLTTNIPIIQTATHHNNHAYIDNDTPLSIITTILTPDTIPNSINNIIIHTDQLDILNQIIQPLQIPIHADEPSHNTLTEHNYAHLHTITDPINPTQAHLTIKTVKNLSETIKHINHHASLHTELIITNNHKHAQQFLNEIDAALLYHNTAPTTHGTQFGTDLGISTQKLGIRGPITLTHLTTYKYITTPNT